MSEPGFQERLDSWKAIADYLGRDVATVRRWEKSLGLPVRRVPGGPGSSVFAFRQEIDDWLKASRDVESVPDPVPAEESSLPELLPVIVEPPTTPPVRSRRLPAAVALAVLLAVIAGAAYVWNLPKDGESLHLELQPQSVVARDRLGNEEWRYDFGPSRSMVFTNPHAVTTLSNNGGFLVAASSSSNPGNGAVGGGELLWLSVDGQPQRRAVFTDRLSYGQRTYGGPWVVSDYRVGPDLTPDHIAVAIRHYQWWPSIVTLLGRDWQPAQKFVNSGWVEHLAWTQPDRLVISGFYNPLDGGMVALLNVGAMNGASPTHSTDPTFLCTACGPDAPLRYIVLPRSEINRAVTAPFNRALLEVTGDRIIARTTEEPNPAGQSAEALYEFTTDLELISATYGDRYWDRHRALEATGQLDHPRERCPERRGPPFIRAWAPGSGWTKVVPSVD